MDELQALWRKASAQDEKTVNQQELEAAISRRSSDELEKFRRVIKKEYLFTWPVLLAAVVGAILLPEYWSAALPLVTLYTFLVFFYQRALRQFKEVHYEDDLKTYLQHALRFLKSYVRHYKIICWASGAAGFSAYFLLPKGNPNSGLNKVVDASPTVFLIGAIVLVIFALLGTHLYIKYLYQARINRLEKLLNEISEG
ncbi:MAG: hypothetical protein WBA23_10940 [Tunicatimonas sp.]|uniref:hypothetical protein n=1 Tax=Tunicatimonas sp. TaxID=1940096 RepID=UPI003C72944D